MKASLSLSLLTAFGLVAAVPHDHHTAVEVVNSTAPAPAYTIVVHIYALNDTSAIANITAKLQEASQVYSNDKETLDWYVLPEGWYERGYKANNWRCRFVMHSVSDPRAFTIVERYAAETSQQ